MNKHDKKYIETQNNLQAQIDDVFSGIVSEIARGVVAVDVSKEFTFSDHPVLSRKTDDLIESARVKLNLIIRSSTDTVWGISNDKNDEIVRDKFTKASPPKAYTLRNEEALEAFKNRKISKFTVSERVWKNTGTLKQELQTAIDASIAEGKGAAIIARDIQKYLINPDLKFRRIRDKYGKLKPSTVAAEFHPGTGVYRSSYKNALRLARDQVNKAYRKADWLRWSQMDFVIGYNIIPSMRSTTVCAMCEHLKGVYPKWFVFTGWHVMCMCTAAPLMCSDKDFDILQQAILSGQSKPSFKQPPLPGRFTEFLTSKSEKLLSLAPEKLPDWYSDNTRLLRFV